jgi:hypothetical protein
MLNQSYISIKAESSQIEQPAGNANQFYRCNDYISWGDVFSERELAD